jgi:PAS domain S-box-containing protein
MSPDLRMMDLAEFPLNTAVHGIALRPEIAVSVVLIVALLLILLLQRRWYTRVLDREGKCHALGKRISEFGERLAGSSGEVLDAAISEGLKSIVEVLNADRLCWYEVAEDSAVLLHKYTGSVREARLSPNTIVPEKMPYIAGRLGSHETVLLPDLHDLPEDGRADQQFLEGLGVKSLLLIPSRYSPRRNGVLGLASYTTKQTWAEESIGQLAVAANIIGATLERKYEQRAREESEERFRSLFAQASIGIALETMEGRILEVNPAFSVMLGYSSKEMTGLNCERISHPEDEQIEKGLFEELRQGRRTSYTVEKRFYRKNGSQMWGQVSVSLLNLHPDSPPLVLGMVSDCTAQKTAEASLNQRDQELQRLAGHLIVAQEEERRRISRELHDDIGQRVALLACELDCNRRGTSTAGGNVAEEARSVRAELDALATDIHKLSHELHSASLQCGGLRVALKDLCRKYANNHRLEIDLQTGEPDIKVPPELALCLFRVAQEALANALKHARTEKIIVRVTQDGEKVGLLVRDFGVGFDTARQSGGIGLTSMRERLRLCGGVLLVKSAEGEGTEIAAEVPAVVKVAAAAANLH